jgi:citrate synthase
LPTAADEAVLKTLRRIGTIDAVPDHLARVKAGHERLMGFGHWVYKTYDPRTRILRDRLEDLYQAIGVPAPLLPVMFALARSAGWIALWLEMVKDPEQTTVRSRQLYTGQVNRAWLPVARLHDIFMPGAGFSTRP